MRQFDVMAFVVVFLCVIPGMSPVSAQQTSSFEQLQLVVKPGDKIEVTGTDGMTTKGKIENLTPSLLRMTTKGGLLEFAQKDAFEIKQKKGDSLVNGALIGAVAGAATAGGLAIGFCLGGECTDDGDLIAAVVLTYTGIGAGIGLGLDALIRHHQTIYRQPAQTALRSLRLEPLIGGGRKGAVLKVSF